MLRNSKRSKIFLAPKVTRDSRNDIVLARAVGSPFRNQIPMQLLEFGFIFARKNARCRIPAMFERGLDFTLPATHFLPHKPENESVSIKHNRVPVFEQLTIYSSPEVRNCSAAFT